VLAENGKTSWGDARKKANAERTGRSKSMEAGQNGRRNLPPAEGMGPAAEHSQSLGRGVFFWAASGSVATLKRTKERKGKVMPGKDLKMRGKRGGAWSFTTYARFGSGEK